MKADAEVEAGRTRTYLKSHHLAILTVVGVVAMAVVVNNVVPLEKVAAKFFALLPGAYEAPDTNRNVVS